MARTTRKVKKVLNVDSKNKIPKFELELKNSTINFVLVYADWCGACHRFKKNIWNPMCKGAAKHNRMAIRDDMIKNTSLANAKFDYLPSLLVVDEKGNLQSFESPEGVTNAMPTPKNLSDMKRVVNVPVNNIKNGNMGNTNSNQIMNSSPSRAMPNLPSPEPLTLEVPTTTKQNEGVVYLPTPMVSPKQKGGSIPKFMRKFGLAFTRRLRRLT